MDRIGAWLFDSSGLSPHGFCLLWEPGLLWLHAASDATVGLAYLTIPVALITFMRRRNDIAFRPVFGLFAAFILLCGAGHVLDLFTLWVPAYGIAGLVKAATAVVSVLTAIAVWVLMPQAMAIPLPAQLKEARAAVDELEKRAESLRVLNTDLERSAQRLTEARDAAEELAKLRHYDPLTGLPNRRLVEEWLADAAHACNAPVGLLFLDLDGFKVVNDRMGHPVGDALLVEVARRLTATVEPGNMVARLGGDEFVALCHHGDDGTIVAMAEDIRLIVEAPFYVGGQRCHISTSIGIAFAHSSGGLDLIRAADIAMYVAKRGGGNTAVVFEPGLFDRVTQQFEIESDMRAALQAGAVEQFALLYQPLFGIRSGQSRLVGFEALIRWKHPLHGWLSPALFIAAAEKSGLILPMGDWVLTTALRQARRFRQIHPDGDLEIAVNVSPVQLLSRDFCSQTAGTLEAEGFPPSALCMEVTETILSTPAATAALVAVRSLGVRTAIDDFGIGYSSLSYLRRLPADIVKLDRSFLEDVEADVPGDVFLGAVISLAHAAGKPVVFEGIETQEQFDIVSAAGADMIQGFFLGPPLSAHAAEELVAQHRRLDADNLTNDPASERCR